MRNVRWIQISDLHLSAGQDWAQDVVLSTMYTDLRKRRDRGEHFDFILATGDLAFSGRQEEYDRVVVMLDKIADATNVEPHRIFCIPGNHDVDRSKQKACFAGATRLLNTQQAIDQFISDPGEIDTLLKRQESFLSFQTNYMHKQTRRWSTGHLGYCSLLRIDQLRISVLGLNTAWLCEGGQADHGRLIMGERQVIELLQFAALDNAHVVLAMGHHPFHLINDFDRRLVQRRLEESCHFYHCGHLHEPELREIKSQSATCLTIAAGAAFETRHTHNTFSTVDLDLSSSIVDVHSVHYDPSAGHFTYVKSLRHSMEFAAANAYPLNALAESILKRWPEFKLFSYYVAALLSDVQSEVPLLANGTFTFASLSVIESQEESELRSVTLSLLRSRNLLRLLSGDITPDAFMVAHGQPIGTFGRCLHAICDGSAAVASAVAMRDASARSLAGTATTEPFFHTKALLHDLASNSEWTELAAHAKRGVDSDDPALNKLSRRMLARALSEIEADADRQASMLLYRELVEGGDAEAVDFAVYAALLARADDNELAKSCVLECASRYPSSVAQLSEIAQDLVARTGDRVFRDKFRSLLRESRS